MKITAKRIWKIKDEEDYQDAFDVVIAENIQEAINLYLSQYDYMRMDTIRSVTQTEPCIVEVKEE